MQTERTDLLKGAGSNTEIMIDSTSRSYDPMNEILPLMLGDFPTVSNSWPGNYGPPNLKNHRRAQEEKFHQYFTRLDLKPGMTVLEIGPGWGCFAKYCRDRGVRHISIVPALGQFNYLKNAGFEVYHGIWQDFNNHHFGVINAFVCMGSPEHFCSPKDYMEGKQEEVYKNFFDFAYKVLSPGGKIAGQFMHFNGNIPTFDQINADAPKGSRERRLGLLVHFYPNAWVPKDFNHFFQGDPEKFKVEAVVDGRPHYIWTMDAWGKIFKSPLPIKKWWYILKYQFKAWFGNDTQFKYWAKCFWEKANKLAFVHGDLGHCFFFIRKV